MFGVIIWLFGVTMTLIVWPFVLLGMLLGVFLGRN